MTKAEKQILKNQMLIMDMLARIVDESQEMTIVQHDWDVRQFVSSSITSTNEVIRSERT